MNDASRLGSGKWWVAVDGVLTHHRCASIDMMAAEDTIGFLVVEILLRLELEFMALQMA